jgi:hypothetical protein
MELVPNPSQTLELQTSFETPVFDTTSSLTGVLPLIGGSHEAKVDGTKLFPLDGSMRSGPQARRASATSIRPASILSSSYPLKPAVAVTLPTNSEAGESISPVESKEERHIPVAIESRRQVWRARLYFATQCFSLFLGGWNDSATVSFCLPTLTHPHSDLFRAPCSQPIRGITM